MHKLVGKKELIVRFGSNTFKHRHTKTILIFAKFLKLFPIVILKMKTLKREITLVELGDLLL